MKQLTQFLMLFFICGIASQTKAQISASDGFGPAGHPHWSIYAGSSHPLGEFKDFAKTGVDFGLSYDFGSSKNWGWGFDYNRQMNSSKIPMERHNFPESGSNYQVASTFSRAGWVLNNFGFGPWWLIQPGGPSGDPGFFIKLYAKPGVNFVKSPEARTTFTYNGSTLDLYNLSQQNKVGFGLTTGARFNFRINNKTSFFINPQYVYTSTKFDYSYRDLKWAYAGAGGTFLPSAVVEDRMVDEQVSPNYFNLNLGLRFNIGGKKEQRVEEIKERKIIPTYPPNNANFSEKNYDKFTWKVIGEKYFSPQYKIEVTSVKNPSEKYVGYSSTPSISTKELFKGAKLDGHYTWKVTEVGSSEQSSSVILKSTRSGLVMQLQNISCDNPSFDEDGNVSYTAEVVFENPSTNTENIEIEGPSINMIDVNAANANTSATIVQCGTDPLVTLPNTLTPGSTITACIEFERPIGETQVLAEVVYHNASVPSYHMNESSIDDLPNCMCNACEEWVINEENIDVSPTSSSTSNFVLSTNINVANAQNIIKVTASIVDVRTNGSAGCDSCFTSTTTSGIFSRETGSGVISNGSADWQNNGTGTLYDSDNDTYGNQFEWNSSSATGIDFTTAQNVSMNMNLPDIQFAPCCGKNYIVCIKYTFTNVDCQTCEYVKCYTVTNR